MDQGSDEVGRTDRIRQRQSTRIAPTGITILWPVANNRSPEISVDIVFVHGLNGSAHMTWTSKSSNIFWPRDLLPQDLPQARVLTFGYNANLVRNTAKGGINAYAENLLGELWASRSQEDERNRPIIFVGHSLGGQVTKRALNIAKNRDAYRLLSACTCSIVFMASPHRGSDWASWMDTINRVISAVKLGAERTSSTKELKAFSETLDTINSDFRDIAAPYTIVSFYETEKTSGLKIVEKWSAILEHPSERTMIALPEDHRTICQFEGSNSDSYQAVLKQLKVLVEEASTSIHSRLMAIVNINNMDPATPVTGIKRRSSPHDAKSEGEIDAKKQKMSEHAERRKVPHDIDLQYNIPHFAGLTYYQRDTPLQRVRTGLTSTDRSFGIHGLGGVGKTQLALRYISEYGREYRQVIWIVADQTTKLSFAFQDLAGRLNLAPGSNPSPAECILLVREWLATNTDYLLVFDNADDPDKLKDYLPNIAGSLLITSRGSHFVAKRIVGRGVELETLEADEGAKFLLSNLELSRTGDSEAHAADGVDGRAVSQGSSNSSAELETAKKISQLFGGHPLALSHMASWISETGSTLGQFLEEYIRHRDTIDIEYKPAGASFDYQLSYASCWDFSFSQLKTTPAARLLGILALLDPDKIPEQVLQDYAASELISISPLRTTPTYRLSITKLRRHALVKRDDIEGSLSIHRLVQNATIRQMQAAENIQQAFEDAIECLSRLFPRQKLGHSMEADHEQCKMLAPQLLAVEQAYRYLTKASDAEQTSRPSGFSLFAELLCHCGWYLYETAQSKAALSTLETAREISDDASNGVPPRLKGLIYSNIGVVLGALNQAKEGLEISLDALKIRQTHLSDNDPQIGESLNNCAGCLHDLNELKQAQTLFEQSVQLQERNPERNENLLESAYSNLGRNLMAMREFDLANDAFNKARSFHDTCTGGSFFISLTIFLIGNLRMYQERWDEAEDEHKRALQLRLDSLGPKNRLTGVSYHQVARLLHRRGIDHGEDPPGAISLLHKALDSFKADPVEPGLAPRTKLLLSSILADVAKRTQNAEVAQESQVLHKEATDAIEVEPDLAKLPLETEMDWAMLVQYEYR